MTASRFLPLLLTALALGSGCKALSPTSADLLSTSKSVPQVAPPGLDGPSYLAVLRPDNGTPKRMRLPHKEGIFMEDALQQSGALKTFGRVTIQLWRPRPDGDYHKLDVKYDPSKKRIPAASNYAVHADDLVVFFEDKSTVIDDMLNTIPMPLNVGKR